MKRSLLASACLAMLLAAPAAADDLHAYPAPVPIAAADSNSSDGTSAGAVDKTVENLLKAADHLDAAGFRDEAARFRRDARERALREQLLSRKEAELDC